MSKRWVLDRVYLKPGDPPAVLPARVAEKIGCRPEDLAPIQLLRRSLDARRKNRIFYVCRVIVSLRAKASVKLPHPLLAPWEPPPPWQILPPADRIPLQHRPLVVGTGPAGLFAAWTLASQGYRPVVVEQGLPMPERVRRVHGFWSRKNPFTPEASLLYGEGGAGTFSDGKLTGRCARNDESRYAEFQRLLLQCGAPESIAWEDYPHIGTDRLRAVVVRLRKAITRAGGEVRFGCRLGDLRWEEGRLSAACLQGKWLPAGALVLATGYAAEEMLKMVLARGGSLEARPFQMGLRIEHPQGFLDERQHCGFASSLPPARYLLKAHPGGQRDCYSFCMCPGGEIVCSSSRPEQLSVNGMSYRLRDGKRGNSALVVPILPEDFPSPHPLAGMELVAQYEKLAFAAGGGNYKAPAQRPLDFLKGRDSTGEPHTTYRLGTTWARLDPLLPPPVVAALKVGLTIFEHQLPGFLARGILLGIESRTTSPARILRDPETLQALGLPGLFPAGEGAGYASGIVSSALDGMRAAERLITAFAPAFVFNKSHHP